MEAKNSLTKRELIVDAALKVFAKRGFYSAKIEEIAQEAGVGKGTVYEYFRSKEQLFHQVHVEGMCAFQNLILEELVKEKTVCGKLEAVVRQTLKLGHHFQPLLKIGMNELAPLDESVQEWLQEMINKRLKLLEDILEEGIHKKEIRPISVKLFAKLFNGGIGFIISPFGKVDVPIGEECRIAQEIVSYYLAGIRNGDNIA